MKEIVCKKKILSDVCTYMVRLRMKRIACKNRNKVLNESMYVHSEVKNERNCMYKEKEVLGEVVRFSIKGFQKV